MNCKLCQDKILDSLAASAASLPRDVLDHQQACPACREVYQAQVRLSGSIDAGLHAMVNQEVPASLVPGLRARLDQLTPVRLAWIPRWSFAATVVTVAILAVSVGYIPYRPGSHLNSPDNGALTSPNVGNREPAVQVPRESVTFLQPRTHAKASAAASPPVPFEAVPEVIVPAEQRQALATFVTELPKQADLASALTQPTPVTPDVPVEIALLQIEGVEVKPLEGTPGE
jgi:anti-sigma factor RsiW